MLVQVDDSLIIQWVVAFCIVFIAFTLHLVIHLYLKYFRTTKEAKTTNDASHKGLPLMIIAGLDHFADFMKLREYIPEGVLEITPPIGKGPNSSRYRYILPQKRPVANLDVNEAKNEAKTRQVLDTLNSFNNEKVFLRGAKVPLICAVKNRALAVGFKFLGAMSFIEKMEHLDSDALRAQVKALKATNTFKELGQIIDDFQTGISGIDFSAVYRHIDSSWDQTVSDSISERDQTVGRREGNQDKSKDQKTILLFIMGALGMGIILVVAAKVL
jgi:hypothetical protein